MKVHNFDGYELSYKNGLYGGMAGSKDGIAINGENWIIKYPKSTNGMSRVDISYTTSPLCEYLGSHVYDILGYNVHETQLGIRNGKLVVACKDFTDANTNLAEIRTVKNYANLMLSEQLGIDLDETGSQHCVDLETLMIHIRNNPILKAIPNIEDFFFEQAVVDIFINNSDRNSGNWGILRHLDGSPDTLAPVFDNGGSFQDKLSESKAKRILMNREQAVTNACGTQTVYAEDEKVYSARRFLELQEKYPVLRNAILKVVPLIKDNFDKITEMIQDVPEQISDAKGKQYFICGSGMKALFCLQLDSRLNNLLLPTYEKVIRKNASKVANNKGKEKKSKSLEYGN